MVIPSSYVKSKFERAHIDIAVITKLKDQERNLEIQRCLICGFKPIYDVRVYEPFHILGESIYVLKLYPIYA